MRSSDIYMIAERGEKEMPHLASLENYSFRRNTPRHVARELFETAAGKTANGREKRRKRQETKVRNTMRAGGVSAPKVHMLHAQLPRVGWGLRLKREGTK